MRKVLLAAAAAFLMAAQAGAVCTSLGSGLGLKLPNYGDRGDVWAKCVRDNFQAMNDGLLPSTAAVNYVLKSAPSLTGGLLSTSWANFVSSVTAGAGFYGTFYGSGANLTGVVTSTATGTYPHSISGNAATATTATTATNNVLKAGDYMTGQLTTTSSMTAQHLMLNQYSNPSLTFKGNNENNGGAIFFRNSSAGSDYDWKLWHQPYLAGVLDNKLYLYPRSSVGGYMMTWTDWGVGVLNGAPAYALDVTGGIRATSTMTASAYYGNGATLTGVIPSSATGTYALSITGNAQTATSATTASAASALAADPADCSLPNVALGINAAGTAVCSQPSNVTGTAANITGNLAAAQIAAGSLGASVIASSIAVSITPIADEVSLHKSGNTFSALASSVTLQGNAFNAAGQLVKLDSLAKLPAVDGSQLLNLPAVSGGAVLDSTQTFTGENNFTSVSNFPIWLKFSKSYSDFSTAALTNSITLFTLPAGGIVHAVKIKHSTAFAGTSITGYNVSVGITGTLAKYATAFDVLQAVAADTFQISNGLFSESHTATTDVKVTATSVGANLSAATQGSVDVWVLTSTAI